MARYFFDTADGDNDTDENGVELDGDAAAVTEALRFAGAMISHHPEIVRSEHAFTVSVRCEDAPPLAVIRIELAQG